MTERWRPAWADIDIDAVRHNASILAGMAAPAALCAVVKADAYGHGAGPVARAALEGGATWLAVALVEEGISLREEGIEAPILLLSEPPVEAMGEAVARGLVPTVYTYGGLENLSRAAGDGRRPGRGPSQGGHRHAPGGSRPGGRAGSGRHHRRRSQDQPSARCGPTWRWPRAADPVDREFTAAQLERFDATVACLAAAGHRPPMTHVANSAAAIGVPPARRDMVRCGIALYGVAPTPPLADQIAASAGGQRLRPVLSLRTRVTYVRDLDAGERPSYGRCRPLEQRSTVATAPVGYADGVPRRLFELGGEVLIGGLRRPLAGMVTMDQVVIDCGPVGSAPVEVGDEVVLLGRQGSEEVTADEWAGLLGTISYEVLCGIGSRVPRLVVEGGGRPPV